MQRLGIGIAVDRHGRNPYAPRGAHDAAGDLAAVGDKDLFEHRYTRTGNLVFNRQDAKAQR
jgi:hypothetical protein